MADRLIDRSADLRLLAHATKLAESELPELRRYRPEAISRHLAAFFGRASRLFIGDSPCRSPRRHRRLLSKKLTPAGIEDRVRSEPCIYRALADSLHDAHRSARVPLFAPLSIHAPKVE